MLWCAGYRCSVNILIFGQPPERRERLGELMARRGGDEGSASKNQLPKKKQKEVDELFYTEGTPELRLARRWIASFSLQRYESNPFHVALLLLRM